MSETHNNDIRELLDVIPVMPHNLMMEYLTRQYNMTPNKAREVIYNACRKGSNRRPACYVTNDGLAKADYVTMTSLYRKRWRSEWRASSCRRDASSQFPPHARGC